MSGLATLRAKAWIAAPLSLEQKEAHFKSAIPIHNEIERFGRAFRRVGYAVGGLGAGVGICGMALAAWAFSTRTDHAYFYRVDQNGMPELSMPATDAPKLFTEQTAEQYLRAYVEARECYVYDTRDIMSHRVAIMSSPDEQGVYASWFSPKSNPMSPQAVYGNKTSVRVGNFRYTKMPGLMHNGVFAYEVRFDRLEVTGGAPGITTHWMAVVQFSWHPELKMSADDRSINAAGMQVVSYGSQQL